MAGQLDTDSVLLVGDWSPIETGKWAEGTFSASVAEAFKGKLGKSVTGARADTSGSRAELRI